MPSRNIESDDISALSEGGPRMSDNRRHSLFSRSRSASRNGSRNSRGRRNSSSSQSVASSASFTLGIGRRSSSSSVSRGNSIGGKVRSRSKSFLRRSGSRSRLSSVNLDDISVSDSLCSGVIGGEFDSNNNNGSGIDGSGRSGTGVMRKMNFSGGKSVASSSSGRRAYSIKSTPPVPGGVADFNTKNLNRAPSDISCDEECGSSVGGLSRDTSDHVTDDAARRELRKERVREKLDRYKRDQKQLRHSCTALERQLAQTTEKLKEVDSKAAFKIDALEGELRETRGGLERVAKQSTKEVTDQGEVIKTLGKKLIRQAHVIKRQKGLVGQLKVRIEQLQEEMAMQDERDAQRADEYCQLKDEYDGVLGQKAQMQNVLQENIEEMKGLKRDVECDAKSIMELKFNLQQKQAALDRVEKETGESAERAGALEMRLEEKGIELDGICGKLKASEASVEEARKELEGVNGEVERLRARCALLEQSVDGGGGARSRLLGSLKDEVVKSSVGDGAPNARQNLAQTGRSPSILGWNLGRDSTTDRESTMDSETFEDELQAKDAAIETLTETVAEKEETIQSLKSDMVKMSSTYKQDSYLKRKEIAKLKQTNAEYALKLRALEKAFKSVGGSSGALATSTHGLSSAMRQSRHGSRHGSTSMHSTGGASMASKEDKAAAVKARVGLAPAARSPPRRQDSQIVVDSNFFDGSDNGSEEGRKGDTPEEC